MSAPGSQASSEPVEVVGLFTKDERNLSVIRPTPASRDGYFVSPALEQRYGLRRGDQVRGYARSAGSQQRYAGLDQITEINGVPADQIGKRPRFDDLTPVYPDRLLRLETGRESITGRMIDLFSPLGVGQRALIVAPPKAGKTTFLKDIARGIAANSPETHIIVCLVGERPEEVTDFSRTAPGEIFASNFDQSSAEQIIVAELAGERARRLVEMGRDVVLLLDSLTRLARVYNIASNDRRDGGGKTMSGGLDAGALVKARSFLGAARNIENGGSLTIVATCLVGTESRGDDVIYEELKGTGNAEIILDRGLQERRVFPAMNLEKSGTRRDDLLIDSERLGVVNLIRRFLANMNGTATEEVIKQLRTTETNDQLLERVRAKAKAAA